MIINFKMKIYKKNFIIFKKNYYINFFNYK